MSVRVLSVGALGIGWLGTVMPVFLVSDYCGVAGLCVGALGVKALGSGCQSTGMSDWGVAVLSVGHHGCQLWVLQF